MISLRPNFNSPISDTLAREQQRRCSLFSTLSLLCATVFAIGCQSHLQSNALKSQLKEPLSGKTYYLTHSVNIADFAGDRRTKELFDEADESRWPNSVDVLPFGTQIQIDTLEWPSTRTDLFRPLFSPRNRPWLYLRVARERGSSLFKDARYVIILPDNLFQESDLKLWLKHFFTEKDPNQWLYDQPNAIRSAILKRTILLGMSEEQVIAALGPPKQRNREPTQLSIHDEVLVFLDREINFIDGRVTKIIRAARPESE